MCIQLQLRLIRLSFKMSEVIRPCSQSNARFVCQDKGAFARALKYVNIERVTDPAQPILKLAVNTAPSTQIAGDNEQASQDCRRRHDRTAARCARRGSCRSAENGLGERPSQLHDAYQSISGEIISPFAGQITASDRHSQRVAFAALFAP